MKLSGINEENESNSMINQRIAHIKLFIWGGQLGEMRAMKLLILFTELEKTVFGEGRWRFCHVWSFFSSTEMFWASYEVNIMYRRKDTHLKEHQSTVVIFLTCCMHRIRNFHFMHHSVLAKAIL